jgi:hypothetical protein
MKSAPGNEDGVGAHRNGQSTMRQRQCISATMFIGGECSTAARGNDNMLQQLQ